jgi:ParB family chromosome partitioning protein
MAEKKAEKQRHLGRGLESLLGPIIPGANETEEVLRDAVGIPNFPSDKELYRALFEIDLDAISPNPYQVRTVWDEQELEDLAQSIRANGVIQPIIVRRAGSGYQLIAGERRVRAAPAYYRSSRRLRIPTDRGRAAGQGSSDGGLGHNTGCYSASDG